MFGVEEIKTVQYMPTSHPFVERLIGTVRCELLDQVLFWNAHDLERRLETFRQYYNNERGHCGVAKISPERKAGEGGDAVLPLIIGGKIIVVDYLSCPLLLRFEFRIERQTAYEGVVKVSQTHTDLGMI